MSEQKIERYVRSTLALLIPGRTCAYFKLNFTVTIYVTATGFAVLGCGLEGPLLESLGGGRRELVGGALLDRDIPHHAVLVDDEFSDHQSADSGFAHLGWVLRRQFLERLRGLDLAALDILDGRSICRSRGAATPEDSV